MSLSPEQFAAKTGASIGFTPAHAKQWMELWKLDMCENDQFHTCFPRMSLQEARRVWAAMEAHFFARYDYFLRVWPESGSSGIWSVPYPGSRSAGGMVDYQYLPVPVELVERFKAWQFEYGDHGPWAPEKFDWACVGPRIYVEHRELVEVLINEPVPRQGGMWRVRGALVWSG